MITGSDLGLLASGDEHELAVQQIREDVRAARVRLREAHSFFYPDKETNKQ